jgi:hypothetical protein
MAPYNRINALRESRLLKDEACGSNAQYIFVRVSLDLAAQNFFTIHRSNATAAVAQVEKSCRRPYINQ